MIAKRRLDYDILRICSMLAVVYLHTAAGALRVPSNVVVWQFANGLTALFTTAVPLFFMLSGALLLSNPKTADIPTLFKARLPKVLVPLVAWSLAVVAISLVRSGSDVALPKLTALLNTPILVPYWFLYALIPMYLISPFLKKMADGLTGQHWGYMIGLWLVLTIGLRTLRYFIPIESVAALFQEHWTLNINFVSGYLGYFLLGAALERWKNPPSRKILWISGIALYLIIAVGTAFDTLPTEVYSERYKSYLNLFAALLAIVVFLLVKAYCSEKNSGKAVTALSGLSFGIYLVHPLAIEVVQENWVKVFGNAVDTLPEHIAYFAVIFLGCLVGTFILASIPVVCYLFTGQKFKTASRECNLFALFAKK